MLYYTTVRADCQGIRDILQDAGLAISYKIVYNMYNYAPAEEHWDEIQFT